MSCQDLGRDNGRIGPLGLRKLDGDQKCGQGEDYLFHPGFVHFNMSICGALTVPGSFDLSVLSDQQAVATSIL